MIHNGTGRLTIRFPCSNIFPEKKIGNNTEETPFVIPDASTEPKNNLRVNLIIESEIAFLLEIDRYSCD